MNAVVKSLLGNKMKYKIDHDLHIHSYISACSNDPLQNNDSILQYAKDSGLKTICLTDHFWDEAVEGPSNWYRPQNYEWIKRALPLPQADGIRFLFGCETELRKDFTLGISKESFDKFDFVIIPTTHLHMMGFTLNEEDDSIESRAKLWVDRFEAVLNMDLPFHKVGIAHLTCSLATPANKGFTKEDYLRFLNLIPQRKLDELFTKAAKLGVGIELNLEGKIFDADAEDSIFRIYKTAKNCGCKFYLGSDAHNPGYYKQAMACFNKAIAVLDLTEDDKFII